MKIICANDILTPEEFKRYMTVLEVDFPKVYQAYLQNVKVVNLINDFISALNVDEPTEAKKR